MKKKNINFSSRLAVAKKISIKALDFEKLPRKFSGMNYAGNTFLNITRSSSNRGGKDNLTSSLSKQKGKIFFAKPLTSRSRNENAIKLNVIPKTTATVINITPGQKAHPINKPKPFNKLFTHSLYVSYNNSSSTYKTFNTNNQQKTIGGTQKTLSILNKMGESKTNSRNQSKGNNLVNNSTFSVFMNSKDSMNITSGTIEKIKKIATGKNGNENVSLTKSTLSNHNNNSNSNSKGFKNTIKHFSNGNLSSLSHKKLGIKVKKKAMKSNNEDTELNLKRKINKLYQLPLFQNFNKLKILILWRNYIQRNTYEYKYLPVYELVENKIIKNYYKKGIIKKYNLINKEEIIWKNYPVPEDYFDIDEKNKDELLLNLCEKALNTYKNLMFCNNKALNSISLYIFELMTKKLYLNLKKVRFIMKYYYDQEKKAIIKKPSVTVIKGILMKLNKIIESPNIKNKIAQEFIIHNTKIIGNLNLNKSQVKPIISQYLELYKGNKTISSDNLKDNFVYGNIINDFRALQIKKNGYIYKDIINELKALEDEIISSYMNEEDLDIILYKIQPIKYNINIIEQKILSLKNNASINNYIEGNKEKTKNKIEEIIDIINKLKERLELFSNIIEKKYGELSINDKLTDIKFIISYIEFLLIKNNIVFNFENELKGIDILIEQNNSQRNKKIFDVYTKFYKDNKNINFDYIHFLIIYDKLIFLIKNNNNKNNKIENKYNDLIYYNKIISYKDEFNKLYNKLIIKSQSNKNNLLNNEINSIYSMYTEINKYKIYLENIKEEIVGLINTEYKEENKDINYELFYKDVISQYIKYDKDKENNDNTNYKKETNILEKILFKHISTIKNNEENNLNNLPKDNSQFKTLNDFPKITKILEEYYYDKKNKDPKILNKIYEELKLKNYFNKNSSSSQESASPYPKLYFLSEQKRENITKINKITLNDITKYFNKVNQRQELEISSHHNKNIITGIKLYSYTKKEFEIFKFNSPITIPSLNTKIKNALSFLSNIYKNIDKEIESSLIQQLLQSLSTFSKKDFHTWVNTTFNQISICTLCLIFTNEISNLLADDTYKEKMPLKEYNLINQKYNQWLTEECCQITDTINRVNIILTIISQMNIIDSLIKNNVYDINSFNWLKYIRHLWDKSKKDVIIECGGWGNYQMKQLIPYNSRILLSPDTDKVFLFNSSCFREKSASIIKVINNKYNNISYKEIFEEYCSLFWTNMISVDANIIQNYELKRVFDVCTIDRSWIFIDNLDLYNTNSTDNINNLIYFSKFIQTIQQEVILNDIKFNDGEKMFCIMGCLNVDDDIKKKCEYLKGSSRLLNFIKPDIDFYMRTTFKLYKNQEIQNINLKKNIESLLKYEQIIRNKLNGFYFDYDFYNEYINYLVDILPKNNFYNDNNKDNKDKNGKNEKDYEELFSNFLKYYSDKFLSTPNNTQSSINENMFINYFNDKNIIYNKEIIELFKYLYFYANEKLIKRNVILKGYGRHFIIDNFKLFYQSQTTKNFDENQNLNIIYYNDKDNELNHINKNDEISKIFDLSSPKNKKLLKLYMDNINQRLKKLNYILPDELKLTILEYIHKVIKANSNNVIYYKLVYSFNNWITKFLNYLEIKKKIINNINLFNIITECLLLSLAHEKGKIKSIIEISNEVMPSQITKQLLQITNKNLYFYYDINNMSYKTFNSYLDYIKNLKNYLQQLLPKVKLEFIVSEHFGNNINHSKNDLSFIYDNEKYIITDDIKSQYIKNNNNKNENNNNDNLKIFIGYNDMFEDHKFLSLLSNDKIKEILNKLDKKITNKFLYVLSFFDIKNLSIQEIIFIYNSINRNSKEVYDIKYIQNPLYMIKIIYKALPKANYQIKLDNNKLLIFLFKNQIFKNSNVFFEEKINNYSNNVYLDLNEKEIKIKIINEILTEMIENKKLTFSLLYKVKNIKEKEKENNNNELNKKINNYIDEKELLLISTMLNDIYSIQSEEIFREKYPNNTKNYEIFNKIYEIFEINQKENKINDNYYNSRLLIHYLKYKNIKEDSLKYKTLTSLGTIFNNKTSKINEISILINNTLTNYKELISNKDEYINSKYYYFNSMKISYILNENLYNSTLEKIYLSVSNHFLFSLLLTFEIMVNNFEISVFEKNYALDYIKTFYVFPSDNVIKFKYENETDSFKSSFINDNGKKLIEFYTKKSKSIDNKYLTLLNNSLNSHNNKYFYTQSIKKIPRDIDKLLYYITFIPDQSSSIFKYLINKYLLKILNLSRFNINVALRKVTTKQNMQPITVKAFPSINITNFLCSLSAYFEINFYIVRDGDLYKNERKGNINYGYKYLIDCDLINLIKEGMKKGYWILICENNVGIK